MIVLFNLVSLKASRCLIYFCLNFGISLVESEVPEGSLLELIVNSETPHALSIQRHCARTAGRDTQPDVSGCYRLKVYCRDIVPALAAVCRFEVAAEALAPSVGHHHC